MRDAITRLTTALADRYRIERELGAGGMATVYLAEDLRHDRKVALKVLKPELTEWLGAERFIQEIKTTASLRHPHILPLFDSGEADGSLFYVMPFVDGESLRDRLAREGPLSIDDALTVAREVADGLAYAHEAGVVHRDIKPANILLSGNHAAIADFGIARGLQAAGGTQLTRTGTVIGTPTYMSPEQATGGSTIDGRSDIYSLGCVLYEMLAGEPPFTGNTPVAILAKKATGHVPEVRVLRDAVPPWLEAVVTRALAKSPADRFSTARALATALAGPGTPHASPARGWPGTRGIALAIFVIVALLAAGLWGRARLGNRGPEPDTRDTDAIAVLPFTVRGGGEFEYLREGMVDLLSTKLDGVGGLRLVDPQAMLATISDVSDGNPSPEDLSRISAKLGVGRVIQGTVLPSGRQLLIRALVFDAVGRNQIEASAQGTADDLFGLVDRLVSELVASGITGAEARFSDLGELTTRSNEALRLYLDGVRNFRQGRGMQETLALLRRAVALDSTFALAAYWAGYVAEYDDLPAVADFQLATRHGARLSPRAKMRLQAALAGSEGRHAEAIALYRGLVERYPDDVAGWFQLAEQLAHTGHFVGQTAASARPAYERAVGLEPALAPAYLHLALIAGMEGDTSALEPWAARLDSVGADPVWPAIVRMTSAGLRGDTALLDASVKTFLGAETQYPPMTLAGTISVIAGAVMVANPGAARRIMERYAGGVVSDTSRAAMGRRRARFEAALGRFEEAESRLRAIGPIHQALLPYDLAWVALHPAALGDERAREAARRLRAVAPRSGTTESAVREYLLARLALRLADVDGFRTAFEALRRQFDSESEDGDALGRHLVLELAALDAERQGEPGRGLDSLLTSAYWKQEEMWPREGEDTFFEGFLADRWPAFLRAELLRQAGQASNAALWYQIAADGSWHRAIGLERLGELDQESGNDTGAREFYADVLRMWEGADAEVEPMVDDVRRRMGG
jgi:tetratricopeptide (TPR) repeat protein